MKPRNNSASTGTKAVATWSTTTPNTTRPSTTNPTDTRTQAQLPNNYGTCSELTPTQPTDLHMQVQPPNYRTFGKHMLMQQLDHSLRDLLSHSDIAAFTKKQTHQRAAFFLSRNTAWVSLQGCIVHLRTVCIPTKLVDPVSLTPLLET